MRKETKKNAPNSVNRSGKQLIRTNLNFKSEFEKGATQKEKWERIKTAKKNYTPTFTKMKDIRGNRVLPDKQADAKAEYLAEIQWKKPEATAKKTNPRKIITHNLHITENEITIRELKAMIKRLKKNKAPGPDKVTVELFKLLNIKNQKILLDMLNECWIKETIPEIMTEANVASLYKKGDTQNLANYRPIALLNCMYKIYAGIIQKRISEKIDPYIQSTQFGFRQKRSTAQALYIARRVQDIAEQSGDQVVLTMLDWEKAFDKINQERLLEALTRLNIPDKVVANIGALYEKPQFRVVTKESKSEYKHQSSGIRQGCPLSPFLFILVMSVMFEDIHVRVNPKLYKINGGLIDGLSFTEVVYADDTLLVTKDAKAATILLQEIETESRYYDMKLNEDKCEVISMNKKANVKFKSGKIVNSVESTTYLGGTLTRSMNPAVEIRKRKSATMPIVQKLSNFWKKAKCTTKWKLNVYNAVVLSKLA